VFVSSLIIYVGGGVYTNWAPLGGDGIVCDTVRFNSGFNPNFPITAKYRRRIKCVLRTEDKIKWRGLSLADNHENIHRVKLTLEEVAT
jgi:hypothetical protein